jgi:hypothetical protein
MKQLIESDIQQALVKYISLKYPDALFSSSNGDIPTTKRIGLRAVKMGYCKGIPDLMIFEPRHGYHGLFIELKRDKKSVVSDVQKVWIERLMARNYKAVVGVGLDECIKIVDEYLGAGRVLYL